MRQHIKKILILIPVVLLLNGCGVGGFLALSKLFTTIGKLWFSFWAIFHGGRVAQQSGKIAQQNPEATGQIIFMILLIGGIAILLYYFSKKQKSKSITKTTATTTIKAKQENIPKEKLSSDETPKVEEKITQPQQETAGVKIGYWLAKNLENFKDPKTLKNKTPNEKKNQETKKEIKKDEPKKILTWDEPIKPEPKKEEPVKEEIKSSEITITSQEEEIIYAEVAKELKENRNEGVWLKAFTENDGDETKTKIAYTKKRVTDLMEELKKNKKQ